MTKAWWRRSCRRIGPKQFWAHRSTKTPQIQIHVRAYFLPIAKVTNLSHSYKWSRRIPQAAERWPNPLIKSHQTIWRASSMNSRSSATRTYQELPIQEKDDAQHLFTLSNKKSKLSHLWKNSLQKRYQMSSLIWMFHFNQIRYRGMGRKLWWWIKTWPWK